MRACAIVTCYACYAFARAGSLLLSLPLERGAARSARDACVVCVLHVLRVLRILKQHAQHVLCRAEHFRTETSPL